MATALPSSCTGGGKLKIKGCLGGGNVLGEKKEKGKKGVDDATVLPAAEGKKKEGTKKR